MNPTMPQPDVRFARIHTASRRAPARSTAHRFTRQARPLGQPTRLGPQQHARQQRIALLGGLHLSSSLGAVQRNPF
jgi:hypothetical protein